MFLLIIVERKADHKIVIHPNINSKYSSGIPFELVIDSIIEKHGGSPEDYRPFYLHDTEDSELVGAVMGAASWEFERDEEGNPIGIIVHPKVEPESPQLPTMKERLEALELAMLELALGGAE